jgi:hypothetical protein
MSNTIEQKIEHVLRTVRTFQHRQSAAECCHLVRFSIALFPELDTPEIRQALARGMWDWFDPNNADIGFRSFLESQLDKNQPRPNL